MKIKLTKEQVDLLLQGSILQKGDVIYCHLPYWYKGTIGGDEFEVYFPDKLPEELLEGIKVERNGDCLHTEHPVRKKTFTIEDCFKNPEIKEVNMPNGISVKYIPDSNYGEL